MPKQPIYTDIVPNPLHQYASYSYALSLWWMDPSDYNSLMNVSDVNEALAFDLFKDALNSYVIAEDSGLFPDRRHPLTYGLIYNLQDLEINTIIASGPQQGPTNYVTGKFKILEPYGVTLINVLANAAIDQQTKESRNYIDQVYILQVDFVGYDDFGNEIPRDQTALYRKRFPIRISKMAVNVGSKGAEYDCDFLPAPVEGFFNIDAISTPIDIQVTGSTIDEFFNGSNGLAEKLNAYQRSLVAGPNAWGDYFSFDIDPEIAESSIVNPKEATFVKSGASSTGYDPTTKTWSIPRGTQIHMIINKIMSHSGILIGQMGLEGNTDITQKDQTTIINLFKVLMLVKYQGQWMDGEVTSDPVYDFKRNLYAKSYNFKIVQSPSWQASHPALSQFADPRPYCTKAYDYLYTGQNIDIINWDLKFDHTYYVPVIGFSNQQAASTPSASVADEVNAQTIRQTNVTPSVLTKIFPALTSVVSATPLVTRTVVGNQNTTTGLDIANRPAAVIVADAIQSTYYDHQSSQMTVTLEIVGDPTLIKQDEWLYVPSPNIATNYNNWDKVPQSEFVLRYGHLRLDAGDIIVSLVVRTPIDIDSDLTNEGAVFPNLNTIPSVFNGFFKVTQIQSVFSNGKFTQQLTMVRYINCDYVMASPPIKANTLSSITQSFINSVQQSRPADNTSVFFATPSSGAATVGTNSGNVSFQYLR